ncbi:MAG: type II toxin-antitoxin system VapC family toxin [Verrucomicrobiota bacterium]
MSWLVDTNVLSELSRRSPDPRVTDWLASHEDKIWISVLTLGELEKGLARVQEPARRVRLHRWIRREVPDWFSGRILPIDLEVAVRWGRLTGELRDPMPAIDSLLAATAMVHGLKIATRNVEDFAASGVPILNPWK